MSTRVSLIAPERNAPPEAWDRTRDALRGKRRPSLDARSLKVLKLLTAVPCDVRIRPGCFEMWPMRGGHHQYLSELAAPVVHHLIRRLGLSQVPDARVGLLERIGLGASFGKPMPRAVWIVPGEGEILLFLREAPSSNGARVAIPVPSSGPWALPIPYAHPETHWVPVPRACPHCGSSPELFRALGSALVCPECGRSFDRPSRVADPPRGQPPSLLSRT